MASTTELQDTLIATDPDELRDQAMASLKKRRDFKTHAFIYLTINLLVWAIWTVIGLSTGAWFPWPVFITAGWGIGVAANAWDVYVRGPITEAELQRVIDRLAHLR
jgi:hypothetical protein